MGIAGQIADTTSTGFAYPLSFAQERLWFLDQLSPGNPFYNIHGAIRLATFLSDVVLRQSVNEIVRRHESLRTTFPIIDGKPAQFIAEELQIDVPVIDLGHLGHIERQQEAARQAEVEAKTAFDLERGPLLRVKLLRLGRAEHVLLLSIHHIVADGWSMGVLGRELAILYRAFAVGASSPLLQLPIQYADFAVWQRQWLSGPELERQLGYWRRQLAELPTLHLPTDRPRPDIQSFRGETIAFTIDAALARAVKALSHRSDTTLFMTLLAAFAVLLHRYSTQADIVVGSPIANRNGPGLEDLIGFFVNTLVLRIDASDDPTFEQFLQRVRNVCLDAYAHQDVPFEKLVEELDPERLASRNPLFQIIFQLLNTPTNANGRSADFEDQGLIESERGAALFDLRVDLWEKGQGLAGRIEYSTDLFERTTIENMIAHFLAMLAGAAATPLVPLSSLPLLSTGEKQRILQQWSDTATVYPRNATLHELFEEQARAHPDSIAIEWNDLSLSYRQVDRAADHLADELRRRGVGRLSRVGICMHRSPEMLVAFLGTLKSGAAYVPLDSSYPLERIAFMISDAKIAAVIVSESADQNQFAGSADAPPMLRLSREWLTTVRAGGAQRLREPQVPPLAADDPCYVMYTSGSTGTPKGIVVPHRAVVRLVRDTDYIDLRPTDRVAQVSNAAFDAATFEVWGALLNGGRVVGFEREITLSPGDFAAELQRREITVLFLTTALFNLVAREAPESFRGLRYLLFGGEAVEARWVRAVLTRAPPENLLHVYGPTENTTFSTWYSVVSVAEGMSGPASVPIGGPIANTTAYVLDPHQLPVPPGVPGELYLGGDGLATEYLNRPELTLERFVPNPYGEPGARLYRTGDRVRWRANAGGHPAIEFLGRLDDQVKVRGFRVEPGEIEAALVAHATVRAATVVTYEDANGDRQLAAYVVPNKLQAAEDPHAIQPDLVRLDTEHLAEWRDLFDGHVYDGLINADRCSERQDAPNPTFNIAGWISSYTGQPIAADEMRQWVEGAVDCIMKNHPRKVLEIGCGTGLLLFRLAPRVQHYLATDFSPAALAYVRHHSGQPRFHGTTIELQQRDADDFSRIEPGSFDAVLINSVSQYLPDVSYLLRVIEGAVASVAAGGFVFVGDVRSFPLLETFHLDVQLGKSDASATVGQLRRRVRANILQENELTLDPAFFLALPKHLPAISHVRIEPERGAELNELTCFRYNVTIRVGTDVPCTPPTWTDWSERGWTMAKLRSELTERNPSILAIMRIPNARLAAAIAHQNLVAQLDDDALVSEVRAKSSACALVPPGVNPEDLWRLAEELGYTVDISWLRHDRDDSLDVVFQKIADTGASAPSFAFPPEPQIARPWPSFANAPTQGVFSSNLVPRLRGFLKTRLPAYMLPSTFIVVNELPLTPNGKIDRKALPAPTFNALPSRDGQELRSPVERKLGELFVEILGTTNVGIHDDFFTDLGGHSLLATRLASRIRNTFQIDFPLARLFEASTIALLATAVEEYLLEALHQDEIAEYVGEQSDLVASS